MERQEIRFGVESAMSGCGVCGGGWLKPRSDCQPQEGLIRASFPPLSYSSVVAPNKKQTGQMSSPHARKRHGAARFSIPAARDFAAAAANTASSWWAKPRRRAMHNRTRGTGDLLTDRRALIAQVLESYRRQGGKVVWPSKEDQYSDVSLDNLDVDALLEAMKQGHGVKLSRFIGQGELQKSKGQRVRSMDTSASTPSHQMMSSIDSAWENTTAGEPPVPSIKLPELDIGLDEYDLQEIAFTLFSLVCVEPKDEMLADSIRRQLELSCVRGEDISRMVVPFKDTHYPRAASSMQGSSTLSVGITDSQARCAA